MAAAIITAVFGFALLLTVLIGHPTPLYFVETDLLGETVPAAKALASGSPGAEHFQYKGPGYPLLLWGGSVLCGGDYFLAARILNVLATIIAAWFGFLIFRRFLGNRPGLFVLVALMATPAFLRAAVEAGTDMPTAALALAATYLVLYGNAGRALFVAGLLAGFAIITRYNSSFLVLAALPVLLTRAGRRRQAVNFGLGVALPVGIWMAANQMISGSPLTNLNYLNVAYTIYGQETSWERFWATAGGQFHSLWDVLAFEPAVAVKHIGSNLATRWLRDIRELVPVWLGVLAIPGVVLCWLRRDRWWTVVLHFALCYLILTLVFYVPRFFIYLIPFYLAGAAALLLVWYWSGSHSGRSTWYTTTVVRNGRLFLAVVLVIVSAYTAIQETRSLLDGAPHEVRMAGETLRAIGDSEDRVMARKPHTAYYAGMEFTPIPRVDSIFEMIQSAEESKTKFLFFSGLEANLRRQFEVLVDTALVFPGLDLIEFRMLEKNHFYALYRFTGEAVDRDSMEAVLATALERQTEFAPDDPTPRVSAALHLIQQGRFAEALAEADEAERLSPGNFGAATCRSMALYELGRYEESAEACERAIADGSQFPWFQAQLGQIRLVQGRYAEGAEHARVALESEPTNLEFLGILGMVLFRGGEYGEAAEVLGRALDLQPNSSQGRLYAGWALALSGQPRRALEVLEVETRTEIPEAATIRHLTDSLRTELR